MKVQLAFGVSQVLAPVALWVVVCVWLLQVRPLSTPIEGDLHSKPLHSKHGLDSRDRQCIQIQLSNRLYNSGTIVKVPELVRFTSQTSMPFQS